MRKRIKKWGDSFVVVLSPEDMETHRLKESDIIDITLIRIDGEKKKWK